MIRKNEQLYWKKKEKGGEKNIDIAKNLRLFFFLHR